MNLFRFYISPHSILVAYVREKKKMHSFCLFINSLVCHFLRVTFCVSVVSNVCFLFHIFYLLASSYLLFLNSLFFKSFIFLKAILRIIRFFCILGSISLISVEKCGRSDKNWGLIDLLSEHRGRGGRLSAFGGMQS